MTNEECMKLFEHYLKEEKKASANTLSSYLRDIRQFSSYLDVHTDSGIADAGEEELSEYINWLKANGKSVATVSRSIASLKNLYSYLCLRQITVTNPASHLVTDKGTQKLPQILTSKEVELLLDQPECVDAKGYRDRAMLELLYATGMRVTELIDLNISDVNLGAGVVRCESRGKERYIPMYPAAIKALTDYIELVRPQMLALPDEESLFVNVSGERMSKGHHPPYAAPFLCCPPVGKRRGHSRHPGDAWSRGHILYPGLFAFGEEATQGCLQQSPSKGLTEIKKRTLMRPFFYELACKPGSVVNDHLSRPMVAHCPLARATS